MSGFNPRILSPLDAALLEHDLAGYGLPSEASAQFARHLSLYPIILQDVQPEDAKIVADALRSLGGEGRVLGGGERARLLLAAGEGQLAELAVRCRGNAAELAGAALRALRAYGAPRGQTRVGSATFAWGARTYVMGVVNVTPDSFSGDGVGDDVGDALALAERFVAEGVDIVDVGGESTRPGSQRIDLAEELRRVVPVVSRLARELPVPVSIDAYKAAVAERCLDAGAAMVNDIWGLLADPAMAQLVGRRQVPVILMHNQRGIRYHDLMGDIIAQLRKSIEIAGEAGVGAEQIVVDPGIGFGKSKEQNIEVLHRLSELKVLGRPMLLGTSRKSTIGYILGLPPEERVEGTAATVALGIAQGVDVVRVHDVRAMVRVCRMADAVARWRPGQRGEEHWPGQTG